MIEIDRETLQEENKIPVDFLKADLIIHSSDIFGENKLVLIQHRDEVYRLMITRQGKLILTK